MVLVQVPVAPLSRRLRVGLDGLLLLQWQKLWRRRRHLHLRHLHLRHLHLRHLHPHLHLHLRHLRQSRRPSRHPSCRQRWVVSLAQWPAHRNV